METIIYALLVMVAYLVLYYPARYVFVRTKAIIRFIIIKSEIQKERRYFLLELNKFRSSKLNQDSFRNLYKAREALLICDLIESKLNKEFIAWFKGGKR